MKFIHSFRAQIAVAALSSILTTFSWEMWELSHSGVGLAAGLQPRDLESVARGESRCPVQRRRVALLVHALNKVGQLDVAVLIAAELGVAQRPNHLRMKVIWSVYALRMWARRHMFELEGSLHASTIAITLLL